MTTERPLALDPAVPAGIDGESSPGASMGSFFVHVSTTPRILVERIGLSALEFSLPFASTVWPLAAYTLTLPTLVLLGLNASRKS